MYVVGGLIVKLFHDSEIAEQEFNYFDVDIVTDVDQKVLVEAAKKSQIKYEICFISPEYNSFKFYFENLNIDVMSVVNFNLCRDRELRDININGIYLGIDSDQKFYLVDDNKILSQMIDTQLLGIKHPGLIKACTGHFKEKDIIQIMPQWDQLYQWLLKFGPIPPLKDEDYISLQYTLKCFIDDPVRLLRIAFMLMRGDIKFVNFDYALQLCFNASEKNFFLPAIIEQLVLRKGSTTYYAITFDRYIKHLIKKASKSLNYAAEVNSEYRSRLVEVFRKMMSWCFNKEYFIKIFTLPLTMKIENNPTVRENIIRNCHQLFLSESNPSACLSFSNAKSY